MLALVGHDSTPGFERDVAVDVIDFFNYRTYLRRDGGWLPIDVPTDVNVDIHRQWLLMRPQGDWDLGGTVHPAGSLLAADLEAFLAGDRERAGAVRPGSAHLAAVLELDEELPAAEPAARCVLADPRAGSGGRLVRLGAAGLPAAARRGRLRRG